MVGRASEGGVVSGVADERSRLARQGGAAGEAAEVLVAGITKVKCDGVIAVGTSLGAETAATARATSVTAPNAKPAVGTALEVGAAGKIITASINCLAAQAGS